MKTKFTTVIFILSKIIILLLSTVCTSSAQIRNILLEEFSTAKCGFCPDGDIIAQEISEKYDNVIWVTHHAGFGVDSMTAPNSIPIARDFTTFAPAACINRWDIPLPPYTKEPYIAISRQKWDSIVSQHQQDTSFLELEIINTLDTVNRILECKVNVIFTRQPASGDIRLNLFLVEDSIVGYGPGYDQTNYFNNTPGHPLYGLGNPVVGYVHHRVVRKIPSGAWGLHGVIPDEPAVNLKYTYTFQNIEIPESWKINDMEAVAFVSYFNQDAHKREVLQAVGKKITDFSTGTESNKQQAARDIIIYPNPARDIIFIKMKNGNSPQFIEFRDSYGKMVLRQALQNKPLQSLSINRTRLKAGVYFIRIISGTQYSHFYPILVL